VRLNSTPVCTGKYLTRPETWRMGSGTRDHRLGEMAGADATETDVVLFRPLARTPILGPLTPWMERAPRRNVQQARWEAGDGLQCLPLTENGAWSVTWNS
jgi:hypothetical protein